MEKRSPEDELAFLRAHIARGYKAAGGVMTDQPRLQVDYLIERAADDIRTVKGEKGRKPIGGTFKVLFEDSTESVEIPHNATLEQLKALIPNTSD